MDAGRSTSAVKNHRRRNLAVVRARAYVRGEGVSTPVRTGTSAIVVVGKSHARSLALHVMGGHNHKWAAESVPIRSRPSRVAVVASSPALATTISPDLHHLISLRFRPRWLGFPRSPVVRSRVGRPGECRSPLLFPGPARRYRGHLAIAGREIVPVILVPCGENP
jgi:hypothetical protein